jgi:superfamily II DNA or RNA helicase
MSDFYDDLIHEIDTPELIEIGKLNPAKSYGIPIDLSGLKKSGEDYDTASYYSENKIYKGVVSNYEKHARWTKTILFASNIESSKEVCREFVQMGYKAKHVDGGMSKQERSEIFDWFDKTPDAILCNCGIATAGFDQHDIATVILYRATTSLPLFLQMCGRGSRLSPQTGKTHFNILDFGNNIHRHGFWEEPREWKLKYVKKSNKESASPLKECQKCFALNYASARTCQTCGEDFPKTEKEEREEIELQELNRLTTTGRRISSLSVNELTILQRAKKLKSAFVWRVLRSMGESYIRYYADCMHYSDGWIYRQLQEINDNEYRDYEIRK